MSRNLILSQDEIFVLLGILTTDKKPTINQAFIDDMKQSDLTVSSKEICFPKEYSDKIKSRFLEITNRCGVTSILAVKFLMLDELYLADIEYQNKLKLIAEKYKTDIVIPK